MKAKLLLLFSFVFLSLALGEWVVRKLGYFPDESADSPITRSFNDLNHKKYYAVDSITGWRLLPGRYLLPVSTSLTVTVNHDSSGFRVTGRNANDTTSKKLFLFGCSFTYGCYIADTATLAYRLQQGLNKANVYDMAIPAYGDVQAFLSLRNQIAKGNIPDLVVLNYSVAHDQRNYLSKRWEKQISHETLSFKEAEIPYERLDEAGHPHLLYKKLDYHGIPLRQYSALANLLDDFGNKLDASNNQEQDLSYVVIQQMDSLCKASHATFILAGISNDQFTRSILQKSKDHGIETVDLSTSVADSFNEQLTPPDADIHRHYADALMARLKAARFGN